MRPDTVLEEIRSWIPLQSIPEQVHRPAIQSLVSLDHREHVATRQHRAVSPIRFGLGEITNTVRVVIDKVDHCSDF